MIYIGIDLGTSGVKLLAMNETGAVLHTVTREYPLLFPKPGWSEQEPAHWYEESIAGLAQLLQHVDASQVAGISFGGQMHGLVILDERDEVIRPAILWNDGRTEKQVAYLNEVIGKEALSKYTGNIAFAGFTAPKLLWVYENEPENFARIRKIMLPKDYLAYRLCGNHCTDYSDASGMLLLDVANKCWSEEMLSICHVTREQMPTLYESYEKVGVLKLELAKELGLSEHCVIAAGGGDNAAAAVGTGAVKAGSCNISLGTSGTIFIPNDTFTVDEQNALHSFVHANGKFHLMGCILSAASCNKWWMEDILGASDFAKEQETITQLGENRVFFMPYLMGERSPHNDASVRGAFVGLSLDTKRADMVQAVFEGVAFAMRDCLEIAKSQGIEITQATICGGGAKSGLWRSIMANVLGISIVTVQTEQGPSYGGAMLAAVACGQYETVEKAAEAIVRYTETILPEPELVLKYEARYQQYRRLYPMMNSFYREAE